MRVHRALLACDSPASLLALQRLMGNRAVCGLIRAKLEAGARTALTPRGGTRTGLPAPLKAGIEHLSGLDMDDVTVHHASSLPAKIHAHAYTQGSEIHLAPGQERHLAHEAWHAVQQKQGRVQPTVRFEDVRVNDSPELEHQADVMGARASTAADGALPLKQHGPRLRVARAPDRAGVVQGQWEEYLLQILGTAAVGLVSAGFALYSWPAGRSVADLRAIYQHVVALGDVLTFARIAGWNSQSVIQLASDFAAGPNGLTAVQWAALAARFPPNAVVETTTFARIPGWTPPGINPLVTAFLANPNGLTAAEWTNIAGQLPHDAHAEATAFASIPGWNLGAITAVITDFTTNPYGLTATDWATAAANVPAAAHPVVALIAERGAGGAIVAGTPFTVPQMQRAATLYTASGDQLARVRDWIAAGRKPPAAAMVPLAGPLAGPPPGPALDGILGAGAHTAIRNAINAAGHAGAYTPNPFVRTHAQTLIAAGFTLVNALALLTALCTHAATAADFTRGIDVALAMHAQHIAFVEIHAFVVNHPAVALGAATHAALMNPGAPADALIARPGATAATLAATLAILQPLGGPGMSNFLTQRVPATAGLTLPRLLARLQDFTNPGAQNIAIGNVAGEFLTVERSVNQRVLDGTMSAPASDWIQSSFRLIKSATRAGMLGFLGDNRVNGNFNNGHATNPAYWLSLFARYHEGRRPAALPRGGTSRSWRAGPIEMSTSTTTSSTTCSGGTPTSISSCSPSSSTGPRSRR